MKCFYLFKKWEQFNAFKLFYVKKIKRAKQQSDKGKLLPFFAYEIDTEKVRKLQFLF